MSLERSNRIDKWQEAARVYYSLNNDAAEKSIVPVADNDIRGFEPEPDVPLVPGFGLAEVKYPYVQADLDEADRTLRRADRNKDGYIDRSEAEHSPWTHRDPFEMDLDHDGRLNRLELGQRYARRRLLGGASDELLKKALRTGSGVRPSTPKEEQRRDDSRYSRRGGTRYYLTSIVMERFDSNKNGRLELQEASQVGIPIGRIDLDRDGELSRNEIQTYFLELQDQAAGFDEGLPGWFFELDANRDQQVAMTEFASEWTEEKLEEFAAIDVNGDGLLTSSEVLTSKSLVGGSYSNENAEVLPPRKTIISEIEVSDDFLIGDLNVQLSITHSHVSYLDAYLTGPDGQRIELFTEVGGSDDHFDQTIFDDQSRYPITKARPPFQGTFMPEGLLNHQPGLSSFNGTSIRGVWQLVLRCSRSDRFGMLHKWSLMVTPQDEILGSTLGPLISDGPDSTEAIQDSSGQLRIERKEGEVRSTPKPTVATQTD